MLYDPTERRIKSFVTRAGRLSTAQERALNDLGPQYMIEYAKAPLDTAAAFGRTQFVPDSYEQLAVDFDGDGAANIVESEADAWATAANHLQQRGGWMVRESADWFADYAEAAAVVEMRKICGAM